MASQWMRGNDGTEYYVNTTNGVVLGRVCDAGNGQQIHKVAFGGGDFVALYHRQTLAKAAVERMAESQTPKVSAATASQKPATRSKK